MSQTKLREKRIFISTNKTGDDLKEMIHLFQDHNYRCKGNSHLRT